MHFLIMISHTHKFLYTSYVIVFVLIKHAQFQKHIEGGETRFGFKTRAGICLQTTNIDQVMNDCYHKILESFNSFRGRG